METPRTSRFARLAVAALIGLTLYGLAAYALLPMVWRHHERQPKLAGRPMVTRTSADIPGDPLNIGLVGARGDVAAAMQAIGWQPADPVTVRSSLGIVRSVLIDKPDPRAPVSALFYDGRRQDLAFERASGASARRRHHVRLWKVLDVGAEGRPVWLGSATFDRGVGLSADTGQVTHDIAPDIDAERDLLAQQMLSADRATSAYQVSGVGPTLAGRNGEGDRYFTDGEIEMLVLTAGGGAAPAVPTQADPPLRIQLKDRLWNAIRPLLRWLFP
ncbi:hypothetical protein ASE17_03230 [Phenylobacterium sp. Root77]|uniref:LssY C-terminal domain-containing protein n=1 Tax=unclassified Phenylobacterium TaxID=2640670 RepID=UPI0006F812F7|nr:MULTISPECIES: LssY C-terminal domain-containing protein [unclassified Phenylobacterium]KQW71906.1 hypothetical protein ASC73_07455 [Phenylobacterium sp. Root1277]KQW94827.1 hypothetical protein ASC79_03600 [Phenylobacterium sp. Root1290]KRC44521.1 hypothetical protein ASE17_03230 [Phenylobacterium sp. Root77]